MEFKNLENFNPQACISRKVMALSRITANIFRKYLSPFGVTDSQVTLLFILTKRNDLNQKQLATFALLEKSTLNRNLKRLIDSELISKKDFPIIKITSKGKKLVNDIIPEWRKAMDEIEEKLGPEGGIALNTLTNKLLN